MIKIKVKAKTNNAFKGLREHFFESNKWKNRTILKAHGVTQKLNIPERCLNISYANLLTKLTNKMQTNKFKADLQDDQKQDFIKVVNDFMTKQKVNKKEYEVIFKNDR